MTRREPRTGTAQRSPVEQVQRARRDPALAVLEGFHALKHALRFGADVHQAYTSNPAAVAALSEALAPDLAERIGALLVPLAQEQLEQLAPRAPEPRLVAIARRPPLDPDAVLADRRAAPVVLLETPRTMGNLGACVRVAAAADAAALLCTGPNDPWHPDALRGAAGLHYALPVGRIAALPHGDRPLIALDPAGDALQPAELAPRAVLAFGTERHGLSDALIAVADARVRIPMRAGVSSLNLATSVAAVLFAWRLHDA